MARIVVGRVVRTHRSSPVLPHVNPCLASSAPGVAVGGRESHRCPVSRASPVLRRGTHGRGMYITNHEAPQHQAQITRSTFLVRLERDLLGRLKKLFVSDSAALYIGAVYTNCEGMSHGPVPTCDVQLGIPTRRSRL